MDIKRRTRAAAICGGVVVIGLGTAAFAAQLGPTAGTMPEGVRIASQDWGGKPVADARTALDQWRKARLHETVTLTVPASAHVKTAWTPELWEIGAGVDVDATMAAAQTAAPERTLWTRLAAYFSKPQTVDVPVKWTLDDDKARAYLIKRVSPSVRHAVKDARFHVTGDSFRIDPDQPGTDLDVDSAIDLLQSRMEAAPSGASTGEPIELPVKSVSAHVTAASLKDVEGEVSRFTTHYSETGNRARNIATACSHIDGTVLMPGDIFSYNKVVGPRDEDAGFHMAPVIVSGRLVPGMGGGVCQTSTTLYNAVLMADLKIVRRSHHAFPVHYIAPGRDATVAYGDKDFQFQNSTASPIAIASDGTGGRVQMRIFGKKAPGREVRIERTNISSWGPEVEVVQDGSLAAGRRYVSKEDAGHAGHRVTVWRVVLMNGREVRREVLSHDHYDSFPRIVHIGTRAVSPPKSSGVPHGTGRPAEHSSPATPTTPAPGAVQ